MRDLTIYLGYDSKEPTAFAVAMNSILTRATKPVYVMPLTKQSVAHVYTRERGPTEATEFSMTRFLAPYLNDYEGWALFMDCDMLVQTDIWDLMVHAMMNPYKAVYVAKHNYTPRSSTKMQGQIQTSYPRKNWSSVMLMDCARCEALTPEYVNTASGADLHRFKWISDAEIGELPLEWNWLVGEYEPNPNAHILHYTLGGPWFPETANCDHADLWQRELAALHGAAVTA